MTDKTLYDRLGIERSATDGEVLAAFEKFYAQYGESMPLALIRAYQILRDREKRVLYDWVLDQYHSGFPVEIPRDRLSAFEECCSDFGFELTRHPTRQDTYELSIPARRPPGIDALPASPPSEVKDPTQSNHQRDRASSKSPLQPPPPPPAQSQRPQPVNWWPPRPLVLGSRIYHWEYFKYQVQLVVRTTRTAEIHVRHEADGQPLVINSPSLARFTVQEGDTLSVFGLGELSVQRYWHFVTFVNKSRGNWVVMDGWESTIPWQQAATHFGIRRKRRELHDLLNRYLSSACELALRDLGFSDAEVAVGVRRNVQEMMNTRFKLPWFNLPG